MPKDYIARLVYDRTHLSIAIVKHPLEVVGYAENFIYIASFVNVYADLHLGALPTVHLKVASSPRSCSALFHQTSKSRDTARISCLT
jgi:hypothetical protein